MLEKLERPPIVEVICGVWFPGIPELDAVVLGSYWATRKQDFPGHRIHPAVEQPGLRVHRGVAPLRTWFVSPGRDVVIQAQHDRFYLNWRAIGSEYPGFSGPGATRDRAMTEFEQFSDFCREQLGRLPESTHVEVGKIDHFAWRGSQDWADMMPGLAGLLNIAESSEPKILASMAESLPGMDVRVQLATAVAMEDNTESTIVRMETTVIRLLKEAESLRAAFDDANRTANNIFKRLIPPAQRAQRFGVGS